MSSQIPRHLNPVEAAVAMTAPRRDIPGADFDRSAVNGARDAAGYVRYEGYQVAKKTRTVARPAAGRLPG